MKKNKKIWKVLQNSEDLDENLTNGEKFNNILKSLKKMWTLCLKSLSMFQVNTQLWKNNGQTPIFS